VGKMGIIEDLFSLKDKVAIVTGGGSGIGAAVAEGLAEAGATVVIAGRRENYLKESADRIASKGGTVLPIRADVTKYEDIQSLVAKTLEQFGKIDILWNVAGIQEENYVPLHESSIENFERLIAVDVKGAWLATREVIKECMLKQQSGKIINISSVAGLGGCGLSLMQPVYALAKGAVVNFTKEVATEYGRYGITCNCICPGLFHTQIGVPRDAEGHPVDDLYAHKELIEPWLKGVPLGRVAEPEDMKGPAIFLSSKASDYLTGVILPVDGGLAAAVL